MDGTEKRGRGARAQAESAGTGSGRAAPRRRLFGARSAPASTPAAAGTDDASYGSPIAPTTTSRGKQRPPRARAVDEAGQLVSDLWLDQPDAHDQIDRRELSADQRVGLHHFAEHGYLQTSLGLTEEFCAAIDADIERAWDRRPADLLISTPWGQPTPFSLYDGDFRPIGYRIPDLHGHSVHTLSLYLDDALLQWAELIFDQPPVAIQSLYFEYGSEQALHRDPMFVETNPASHLLAAWIALEDITAESGPLAYVPGSHQLPWIEFEPGQVTRPNKPKLERQQEWLEFRDRTALEFGVESFTCKRGDVFIWHAGLVHGGVRVEKPDQTRKSIVVHYSTAATYRSRLGRLQVRTENGLANRQWSTDVVLSRNGRSGFDAPLRGQL